MDCTKSPGPGQPVVYHNKATIASSTSHLLTAVQCQHFNWEENSVSREPISWLLRISFLFLSLYKELPGGDRANIFTYLLIYNPNSDQYSLYCFSDPRHISDLCVASLLNFIHFFQYFLFPWIWIISKIVRNHSFTKLWTRGTLICSLLKGESWF